MKLLKLALKNIRGSGFRSLAIFLLVTGVASFLLTTTLIIKGSQNSLNSGIQRLGADIIAVPQGTEGKIETALLMGKPASVWMPQENLDKIASVPGVEKASPQLYLASLFGASCCSVSEMFIVVYDPQTDFTITPWLQQNLGRPLEKGEVVGGTYVFVPPGEPGIKLYGYTTKLAGTLEPTGTGIDQTMFMTLETAQDMAKTSLTSAVAPLKMPADSISSVLVKVKPGADVHQVAAQIAQDTTGVTPIESPNLFVSFENQMNGLLLGFLALTLVMWVLAALMMGVNFSMATNQRRREIAVLRVVGAMPGFVFRLVLTEASILAAGGAVVGTAVALTFLFVFKNALIASLKIPFLLPSIPTLAVLFIAGLGLAVAVVIISALVPAIRASKQELAIAMRE